MENSKQSLKDIYHAIEDLAPADRVSLYVWLNKVFNIRKYPSLKERTIEELKAASIKDCKAVHDFLIERIEFLESYDPLDNPIETLHLSPHTFTLLKKLELFTLKDIKRYGLANLRQVPGIGPKKYDEICLELEGKIDIPYHW